ncbi:MAG: hypothetical protein AB8I08_26005 [Sandaracinaceae bacterium]
MSTVMACLGVLLMVGCGTGHADPPAFEEDGGVGAIDGAELRVEEAWWNSSRELRIATAIENRGERAIPGMAARFVVEDEGGRQVQGLVAEIGDCTPGHMIEPGDTARCTARFELGARPTMLSHPSGDATIDPCGADAPFGLCALGDVCVDAACRQGCSVTHQDGACVNEDAVCQAGACVTSCSDSPDSGCEEGVCVDGVCELACHGLAIRDDGCWSCLWDVLDAEHCVVEDRCRDCADCVGGRVPGEAAATTCDCLAEDFCDGCQSESRDYWNCLVGACPTCRE